MYIAVILKCFVLFGDFCLFFKRKNYLISSPFFFNLSQSYSMSVKKADRGRIDAFELWCWRRLLRVPWTARKSNQSILKEISPGCSLE